MLGAGDQCSHLNSSKHDSVLPPAKSCLEVDIHMLKWLCPAAGIKLVALQLKLLDQLKCPTRGMRRGMLIHLHI